MSSQNEAVAKLRAAFQRYIGDEEETIAKAKAEQERQQGIIRSAQGKIREYKKEIIAIDREFPHE